MEVDGDSHYQSISPPFQGGEGVVSARDIARQKFIEACGIRVLRFTDNDIEESLLNVLEIILRELRTTP